MHIYGIRNHVDRLAFVYKELVICASCSQTDWNIARILLLLGDRLMFYRAFGMNLMWYVFCWRDFCTSIRDCSSIRIYTAFLIQCVLFSKAGIFWSKVYIHVLTLIFIQSLLIKFHVHVLAAATSSTWHIYKVTSMNINRATCSYNNEVPSPNF